ncbi:MAG: hypothetical protein ACK5JM_03510 [Rhodoblastus sp.]
MNLSRMKLQGGNFDSIARNAGVFSGAAGWALLIALALSRALLGAPADNGALAASLAVAFALLLTSATLVLLNALRVGFGALDAFFAAALARSALRREEPPQTSPLARAEHEHKVRHGYIGDRPFVANDDGTVTVETLLGPRLFPSLADAQDFIGA